jgi:hypothetical protein
MNDEYTFINPEDLEEHKDSEVPEVSKNEYLSFKAGSEKRNIKKLGKDISDHVTPLVNEMDGVNDELMGQIEIILEELEGGSTRYQESRFDALDVIADIIAHHKVIDMNIESLKKITKKL